MDKKQQMPAARRSLQANQSEELRRLEAELKRVTEERDILKKSGGVLRSSVRLKYVFIAKHHSVYRVLRMCRILDLHPSGYYAWKAQPDSPRAVDDRRRGATEASMVGRWRRLRLPQVDFGYA